MYNTSEAKIFNAGEGDHLPAGIHENVTLLNARMDRSPIANSPFLEITFTKNGQTVSITEWEPKRFDGMTDDDMKKKAMRQMGRMQQILECFYDEKDPRMSFTGANFVDFSNWVTNLLAVADKTKLLKLKAVYNHKGFIGLPSYARYKFIEPMNLPAGQESQVYLIPNTDILVKPVQADQEKAANNPFADNATTTQAPVFTEQAVNSSLPF